ncbi:hypothetical protein BGW38_002997 [Lunasporangiospora selenospora]|uniref:Gti1/Pac2 family protein n=1 Tax=Lunasporangiospora selenospora TaxID=979761 RepID=A0A9P6KJ59_9FUNG|nr:hypothetical protein BGW38_002997 [Lunasporangiospora selenospora]
MDHNMETYFGLIKTPHDALLIFEACHVGIISRVHRRLSDIERQAVRSGSVYCFDEREAGMRRWTDGKSWSPSRVTGSFLTYREVDDTQTGPSGKSVYRADGLLKQSFSITTSDNKKLHLISYYTAEDVSSGRLYETPSKDMQFEGVVIPKGIYPETSTSSESHHTGTHAGGSSPTGRSRQRPHHRSFLNSSSNSQDTSVVSHRRSNSGSASLSHYHHHRYSPIQADYRHGPSRSRSNSHNMAPFAAPQSSNYSSTSATSSPYSAPLDRQYRVPSPSSATTSSFTPPSNAYSPTTSWASDDEPPLVDAVTPDSLGEGLANIEMMTALHHSSMPSGRELPLLARSFDHKTVLDTGVDAYLSPLSNTTPLSPSSAPHEQDSLSVLANLAADTMLLPKPEPRDVSREAASRARWVEDDRQLRALSSMLRL